MPDALLPDLPPTLEDLARRTYSEEALARRALLSPRPTLNFRSAYDERALWRRGRWLGGRARERRGAYERALAVPEEALRDTGQPFFAAPGTGGTLRSPYPEMTDAEFYVFVALWGEREARLWLEKPMPALGGQSTRQVFAGAARPGPWPAHDPRVAAYNVHLQIISGTYT